MAQGSKLNQFNEPRDDKERFIGFAFAAADVLVEVAREGIIRYASGATRRLLGHPEASLIGRSLFGFFKPVDRENLSHILSKLEPGVRIGSQALTIIRPSGREKRVFLSGFCMPNDPDTFYLSFSDPRIMPEVSIDPDDRDEKTGMRTKANFIAVAKDKINTAGRDQEEQLSFLMVKGLEKLRETKGQEAVDELMIRLANRLKVSSLGGDSVGLLGDGRIGILHDKDVDQDTIETETARLIEELRESGDEVEIEKFSIDLKVKRLSEEDASRAMVFAIRQFSDDKKGQFNLSSLEEGAANLLNDTLNRVGHLRKTVAAQSFQVALQPIVDLNTKAIHHYEALTRFEGGKSPAQIISFAEEVEMIEDFDFMIIQRILTMLSKHAKNGWRPNIAVNVSGKSMSSDMFLQQLRKVVMEYGNIRTQLSFELTETAKISDAERLNNVLQQMRRAGHKIYLDDVGSGNTTFQTIHMLQADAIKIEGQYIQRALNSKRDMAVLKSITELAMQLGTEVVGEMIDHEQQVAELLRLKVQYGQGYLFGKPTIDVNANTFGINGMATLPTTIQSW